MKTKTTKRSGPPLKPELRKFLLAKAKTDGVTLMEALEKTIESRNAKAS